MKERYRGDWYLPGSNNKLSGVVIKGRRTGRYRLRVYGETYLEGGSPKDIKHWAKSHDIILGRSFGSLVTLINCSPSKSRDLGNRIFLIEYHIEFILDGIHVANESDLRITKVMCEFPFIPTWFDGADSREDKIDRNGVFPKVTEDEVFVNDNLTLSFIDYTKEHRSLSKPHLEIAYYNWVEFIYKGPVSLLDTYRDWMKFASLIQLVTRKEVPFDVFKFTLELGPGIEISDRFESTNFADVLVLNHTLKKNKETRDVFVNHHALLFSSWYLAKADLKEIIRKWFANDSYRNIYEYYIDSNRWFEENNIQLTNVMLNNRFLNLIQALEGYHYSLNEQYSPNNLDFAARRAEVLGSLSSQDLKQWVTDNLRFPKKFDLKQRLSALMMRFENELCDMFISTKHLSIFPEEAKKFRNLLSHGGENSTLKGAELTATYQFAQLLLALCILESLNINTSKRSSLIKSNYHFERSISDIITGWFPKSLWSTH